MFGVILGIMENEMENKMETTIGFRVWGYIRVILG